MRINYLTNRQLSPDGDGGGGSSTFVPLGDIDAEEEKTTETDETKKADLDKAAADQAAADAKKAEDDAAAAKEAENKKPKEKEPETPNGEEGSGDSSDDASFWDEVDTLRGETLDVDFGDVDPETPEGALIYEKAVRLDEMAKFEGWLGDAYPRALAYLTHITNGGKEEDFFKTAGEPTTLPTEAELEADVEKQKDIVVKNLKAKGNTEKQIERIIKGSIIDDDLEEMAKAALQEESNRQAAAIKAVQDKSAADNAVRDKQIKELTGYVNQVISTGRLDNIIIPEKDRIPFAQAVNSSIRFENGKFYAVTEVNPENATEVFKEKFFSYKKGNLTDLIDKAARTANTSRLKKTITENKKPLGGGTRNEERFTSLAEMED